MFWKYFIDVIDTLSPLVTLVFGIYGAMNETKPSHGKLSRQGRIALTGMIISGMITLAVKGYGLYDKIQEQDRQLVKNELDRIRQDSLASIKRHDDSTRLAFQIEAADKLNKSITELDNIKKESSSAVKSLNIVSGKQQIALENTRRGLNPLFPLKIDIHYTLDINEYLKSAGPQANRNLMVYLDSLTGMAQKQEMIMLKQIARHSNKPEDSVLPPVIKQVDPLKYMENTRLIYLRREFILRFMLRDATINFEKNRNDPANQQENEKRLTLQYQLTELIQYLADQKEPAPDDNIISCTFNLNNMTLDVHVQLENPVVSSKNSDVFVSLYDLQHAILGFKNGSYSGKRAIFKLNQVTIYTGYKFSRKTILPFTSLDIDNCCGEIYTRMIKPEEIK